MSVNSLSDSHTMQTLYDFLERFSGVEGGSPVVKNPLEQRCVLKPKPLAVKVLGLTHQR